MKISFPYMGCVTGYKKIFELLGHEVIMPQRPTQRTIDLGVKYSPEFICFPFKVMMGTYIEVTKAGAEVIISSGGNGPCRAGLYGELHKKILNQMGYKTDVFIFDSLFRDTGLFLSILRKITKGNSLIKLTHAISLGIRMIYVLDKIEKRTKIIRAYERNKGDVNRAWEKIKSMCSDCNSFKQLRECTKVAHRMINSIPLKGVRECDKIRVGIVGEIYVIMESAVNMDIEQNLNYMGIEVENVQYISDWITHNLQPLFLGMYFSRAHKIAEKAKRYVEINCGGHDMENIGWMVDFKERGFDAVFHLMPFGCLPELVSASAIPTISRELNMPILSLSLDEQSGLANNGTRIEAFIELIRNRKGIIPPANQVKKEFIHTFALKELKDVKVKI